MIRTLITRQRIELLEGPLYKLNYTYLYLLDRRAEVSRGGLTVSAGF